MTARAPAGLTPRQIDLARHALGLPNRMHRSYRNRFVAGEGHVDFPDWQAMVAGGFAYRAGPRSFHLTRRGANVALMDGERLCPEDWP